MGRRKGNFEYNYPKVIKFLNDNDIEYIEYADGQHLRIMGDVSLVDLWASRMTYHVIQSEETTIANNYARLSFSFQEDELRNLLNGKIQ